MEQTVLLLIFVSFIVIPALASRSCESKTEIIRLKMTNDILEMEDIMSLSNSHYRSELNLMREDELSKLYRDLEEKFNLYIERRNAEQNHQALEDF